MKLRWERPLLLFSIALNVAFVSLAAARWSGRVDLEGARRDGHSGRRPAPFAEHWQARRLEVLSRFLRLDAEQRRHLEVTLRELEPQLRTARQSVGTARQEFASALRRGDAATARATAREVSSAQARLDSLSAEAMLREVETLRPAQRERYLRWMLHNGPGRGMRRGLRPGLGIWPSAAHATSLHELSPARTYAGRETSQLCTAGREE